MRAHLVIISSFASALALGAPALAPPAGLSLDDAQGYTLDAIASGNVNWWPLRELWFRSDPAQRVALVEQTLRWTKAFVMSPAFAGLYAERRDQSKPQPPPAKGTVEQELAAQRAEQKQQLAEVRASIAQMPAEQRAAMKQMFDEQEKMIVQQQKDPQLQAMLRQGIEADRAQEQQRYQQDLADWQKRWPADPKVVVARRIREFLAACSDVAWAAKLEPVPDNPGRKRFADTANEQRSAEWKLCYRAGKAPVESARTFANAWLKELPGGA